MQIQSQGVLLRQDFASKEHRFSQSTNQSENVINTNTANQLKPPSRPSSKMSRPGSRRSLRNAKEENKEGNEEEEWGDDEEGDWEWEYYYDGDDGNNADENDDEPASTTIETKTESLPESKVEEQTTKSQER